MNSRFCTLLVLAFFLGCQGWQSEPVQSENFEPLLNVLAVLSPDEGGVVEIMVMRTLPLEGPDGEYGDPDTVCYYDEYLDTTFCYLDRPWISYFKVTDATTTLSDSVTIYPFEYVSTPNAQGWFYSSTHTGHYIPVDSTFVPQTGVPYTLNVKTPDGLQVSGSLTIPPPVAIKEAQLPDTVQSGETFTVAWTHATDYARVLIRNVDREPYRPHSCYVRDEITVVEDSSWNFQIVPECWGEEDSLSSSTEVEITITAMDERYYNYFVGEYAGPDYEEMMFIFLGEGDTGKSRGIDGGLGVFASYRSDVVRRWIHQ